jgi:hypothetical protein
VAPNAEFILWSAEDTAKARIHASDESVDPAEIEAMILAQVILLQELASRLGSWRWCRPRRHWPPRPSPLLLHAWAKKMRLAAFQSGAGSL